VRFRRNGFRRSTSRRHLIPSIGVHDIAIDLGTANTVVYVGGQGIVVSEPSVVASNSLTGQVHAVGADAERMIGRTPATISAMRPLRHGVIADFDVAEAMLRYFIRKVIDRRMAHPRLIVCAPSGVTQVEKRAVEEASVAAGARRVHLIEEPIAAAIGSGLEIAEPVGRMVVDVGGGTSEVAVISLGGIVLSRSVRVGGYEMDEAIAHYLRGAHDLAIGSQTAEAIKIANGSAAPLEHERTTGVHGRHMITGLPTQVELRSEEVRTAVEAPAPSDRPGDQGHARANPARPGGRPRPSRHPARGRGRAAARLPGARRGGDWHAGLPRRVAADLRRDRVGPGARALRAARLHRPVRAAPSSPRFCPSGHETPPRRPTSAPRPTVGRLEQGPSGERRLDRPFVARWASSPAFHWPPLRPARLWPEHGSVDVVVHLLSLKPNHEEEQKMRSIGLDIHRGRCRRRTSRSCASGTSGSTAATSMATAGKLCSIEHPPAD
jgi:rod shape-determining protein MreB